MTNIPHSEKSTIRLDKWLWAARIYKTRSIAQQAIEGGKVHYNGQRVKSSKAVELNAMLRVRTGWDEKTVCVTGLSGKRGSANDAAKLYQETEQSVALRAQQAAERKAMSRAAPHFDHRPNKKERRQIHQFKQDSDQS